MLELVCDEDPHTLKRGAKEIPQDGKERLAVPESSLKGVCKRSKICFFLPSHGEGIQ